MKGLFILWLLLSLLSQKNVEARKAEKFSKIRRKSHSSIFVAGKGREGTTILTPVPCHHRHSSKHGGTKRRLPLNLRGGSGGDMPPSSTYWSTRTSSAPTSSSSQQKQRIRVTDVTNELQDQQQQETKEAIDSFLTRDNRNTFIARVYTILTTQLLITIASIFTFARNPNIAYWILSKGRIVPMGCLLLTSISVSWMSASEKARQTAPMKWNLLALFTIGEALVVGLISSFFKSKTVISALSATAVSLISVTAYTLLNRNPKYDLSQWGAGLSS